MRRPNPITPLLVILFALMAGGCQSTLITRDDGQPATPTEQWFAARNAVSGIQRGILAAHQGELITDQDLVGMDGPVQTARGLLDDLESLLPEGGDTFDVLRGILNNLIEQAQRDLAAKAYAPTP